MNAPDSRTRSKIALNPSKVVSTSLSTESVLRLVVSNVLLVVALDAGKEWILSRDVGVLWVLFRMLACAGLGVGVWEAVTGTLRKRRAKVSIEWGVLGMSSLLLFVQQGCLMTALYRLPVLRVVLFTQFSPFAINAIANRQSLPHILALSAAMVFSALSDAHFSADGLRAVMPGYGAVVLHSLASAGHEHTQSVLGPALGWNPAMLASTLGATAISLPFYIFKTLVSERQDTSHVSTLTAILVISFMSYVLLVLVPSARATIVAEVLPSRHFPLSYLSSAAASVVIGPLAFSQFPGWSDLVVVTLLFYGMFPDSSQTLAAPPRKATARLAKAYLKTVLSNPESRKIFYFLVLNLSYMMIQMLYGVWTNSLGLISDAIHMAFDCMAIGMGLFASVMATWPPNERFTYGYGRIETLSGFANGIFLILISIFIVFEAIQRILDPPEMNTSQLLLVSSLGLGVNLFGMFAMGGHHHHGHSHSHGHGHDEHDHSHSHENEQDHGHSHGHDHSNSNSHGHSHDHHHDGQHSEHSMPDSHSHNHVRFSDLPARSPRSSGGRAVSHSHTMSHVTFSVPTITADDSHHHNHDHDHDHDTHHHNHNGGHSHSHKSPVQPPPHRHQRAVSLQIPPPSTPFLEKGTTGLLTPGSDISNNSPITPGYKFGHDEHFSQHHHKSHVPNLHDHSHGHGHDHHEGHSHNMRGVFLHVMADTLGSVGVIISTLLIQFYGWTGFDPIASLFIAVLIAASVIPLVIDSGKVLCLDIGSRENDVKTALDELPLIEGLASYAAPRFWPKDDSSLIGSIRIQISQSASSTDPTGPHSAARIAYSSIDKVVERVDSLLRMRIKGLEELTIQVEGSTPS